MYYNLQGVPSLQKFIQASFKENLCDQGEDACRGNSRAHSYFQSLTDFNIFFAFLSWQSSINSQLTFDIVAFDVSD